MLSHETHGALRDGASVGLEHVALLGKVDAWTIKADDISPDVVQQLLLHGNSEIDALVVKHWPDAGGASAEA